MINPSKIIYFFLLVFYTSLTNAQENIETFHILDTVKSAHIIKVIDSRGLVEGTKVTTSISIVKEYSYEMKLLREYVLDINEKVQGIMKVFYNDGKLKELVNHKDSYKSGYFISYFQDGAVESTGFYKKNDHSICDTTTLVEYGLIRLDITCPNKSVRDGIWYFYSREGDIVEVVSYRSINGVEEKEVLFSPR